MTTSCGGKGANDTNLVHGNQTTRETELSGCEGERWTLTMWIHLSPTKTPLKLVSKENKCHRDSWKFWFSDFSHCCVILVHFKKEERWAETSDRTVWTLRRQDLLSKQRRRHIHNDCADRQGVSERTSFPISNNYTLECHIVLAKLTELQRRPTAHLFVQPCSAEVL